jgi:hypothetical protein
MSVKNEWPTANINFAVVIQKSVVIFLCRAIFLAATVQLKGENLIYSDITGFSFQTNFFHIEGFTLAFL